MKLPHRRQFLHLAAGVAALPAVSRIARAQTYPARPITIVVPVAAGGQSDVTARIVGEHMRATLGQPVLIENVSGAAGTIGLRRVAHGPSDGYTIVMGNWGTHVALGATYQLDFDLLDFAPIAQLPSQPGLIATRKTVPVSNLREPRRPLPSSGRRERFRSSLRAWPIPSPAASSHGSTARAGT